MHNCSTWFIISVFGLCSSHVLQQTYVAFPHHDISLPHPIRQITMLRACAECRAAPYDPSAMLEIGGARESERSVLLGVVNTRLLISFHLSEAFRYSRDIPGTTLCAHNVGNEEKRQQNKMLTVAEHVLYTTASCGKVFCAMADGTFGLIFDSAFLVSISETTIWKTYCCILQTYNGTELR